MFLGDIIKQFRIENNLSMDDFAAKSGISKSYIGMLEKNVNPATEKNINPSFKVMKVVATAMNLDVNDLIAMLDSAQTISADSPFEGNYIEFVPNKSLMEFNYEYYPIGISAGILESIESQNSIPTITVPDILVGKYAGNKQLCFTRVNGDSMNKIIEDQSTIAVLKEIDLATIKNGDIVIATNGHGEYTIKRFYNDGENQRFILRPDSHNPIFTDMIFTYDECDDMQIFGKVVMYNVIL